MKPQRRPRVELSAFEYREAILRVLTDEPISPTRAAELVRVLYGQSVHLGEVGRAAGPVEARAAATQLGEKVAWEGVRMMRARPAPKGALDVRCELCRAKPGHPCTRPRGAQTAPHATRTMAFVDAKRRLELGIGCRHARY